MRRGKYRKVRHLRLYRAGKRVDLYYPFYLVSEEFDPYRYFGLPGREYVNGIPSYTKPSAGEIHLVPLIIDADQLPYDLVPVLYHAGAERDYHVHVIGRAAYSVDTGNAGHNDNVPSLRKGRRRRKPEPVYLIVYIRILLDVGIRRGNIRFRLIIIIIGYKILHRVLGEELLHLAVELACQGLIVGNDKRRLIQRRDDIRHGEGLAGARDPYKGLKLIARFKALHQLLNGLGLVARRPVFGMKSEFHGLLRFQYLLKGFLHLLCHILHHAYCRGGLL